MSEILHFDPAVLQPTEPRCPHFGTCGGCQYQHFAYEGQLALKRAQLAQHLNAQGVDATDVTVYSAEPYHYRNRIRLRIERIDGTLRFGYNIPATTNFLPIITCPISAPSLIPIAEVLLALAADDPDTAHWLNATAELELFTNHDLSRTQVTFFCAPRTKSPQGSFTRMMHLLQQRIPQVAGAAAMAFDPRTGPTGRTLAEHGATGLNYRVRDETYWISRGGFFQVNRFLIATLVQLATTHNGAPRSGNIAWDLFAGVGLFSRVLAKTFAQITAVEASPIAAADLRNALAKLGPQHRAVQQTTLDFLRAAVIQRERPELIVLDPPRAGVGLEACALLARIAAPEIVYVSCDPTTLARDLAALAPDYSITELHLIDLFPQTFHLETVVTLHRKHFKTAQLKTQN
jgi:23S rRNA (uracil1939-C5)-methyltransferase